MYYAWMSKRVHLTTALPLEGWVKGKTLCGRVGMLSRTIERPYIDSVCKQCRKKAKAVNLGPQQYRESWK